MATVIMVATILMTTHSKGNLYTGVVNSQLFSPDGKLLTNGLYPEFKRTGENSIMNLKASMSQMPTVKSKKVLINMMVRLLDLNIVTSANHNGQLLMNGIFLMDTSTISTQHL